MTFQITRKREHRFSTSKMNIFGHATGSSGSTGNATRGEPWSTTPATLAPEVRMTVVLNKLTQMNKCGRDSGHILFWALSLPIIVDDAIMLHVPLIFAPCSWAGYSLLEKQLSVFVQTIGTYGPLQGEVGILEFVVSHMPSCSFVILIWPHSCHTQWI